MRYQVLARGDGADEARDAAVLRDYFNLDTGLAALSDDWAARDGRYAAIRDYIAGTVTAGPCQCALAAGSNCRFVRYSATCSERTHKQIAGKSSHVRAS